jgi:hypothetical protein
MPYLKEGKHDEGQREINPFIASNFVDRMRLTSLGG